MASGLEQIEQIVGLALAEDLGSEGDITSQAIFAPTQKGAARVVACEGGVVSGLEAAREVCRQVDPELSWLPLVEDGQSVPAGAEIVRIEGQVLSILAAERTLLNFLSRLSGVATLTRQVIELVEGLPSRVAATRKTTPGLRLLEKQAVVHGGGETHRLGLYDAVLIKDNHIAAAGSLTAAVEKVRAGLGPGTAIEVEADTEAQLLEAIDAGAARVLLDNMTPAQVRDCVRAAAGRVIIEASGGIHPGNVREFAQAGPDIISMGALTGAATGLDLSLEMVKG